MFSSIQPPHAPYKNQTARWMSRRSLLSGDSPAGWISPFNRTANACRTSISIINKQRL